MKASKIYTLEDTHKDCSLCSMSAAREAGTHFGVGHPNGDILVLIPHPYLDTDSVKLTDPTLYDTSAMQAASPEKVLLSKILDSVLIDKTRVYVIPAVMCPLIEGERLEETAVKACAPRVMEVVNEFSPRVLVLCGPVAYYSFYGEKSVDIEYGIIYDQNGKTIFYTPAINYYLQCKADINLPPEQLSHLAKLLFDHWSEIGKIR